MGRFYWERHPDGPFARLIAVATNYLHPETWDLDLLKVFAKRDDLDEVQVFKSELRQALRDPAQLPGDELSESVEYDNGSPEAFLVWLWHELYADEPSGASVLTWLKALPEPFDDRLQWPAARNIRNAVRAGEWDKAVEMLLAGLAQSNALVSPVEHEELTALLSAIGQPSATVTTLPGTAAGSAHRTTKETRDVVLLGAASRWSVRDADRGCDNLPRPGDLRP